ncbi:sensor histidine kinase [Tsukamurella serpentis]
MASLADLLAIHTDLPARAARHLQRIAGEWQLLADLSFADLRLWVREDPDGDRDEPAYICIAQCRPNTTPTVYDSDGVGVRVQPWETPTLHTAFEGADVVKGVTPAWTGPARVRREAVPVPSDGTVIAVLTRDFNVTHPHTPSPLEVAYKECADDLCTMVSEGSFPEPEDLPTGEAAPRAGDGFIRLDPQGRVVFASPNAQSAYRRMGSPTVLEGSDLAEVTAELVGDSFESEDLAAALDAALLRGEGSRIELTKGGVTVVLRVLGLHPGARPAGAAVLLRDVTELKRRDRALISKDATIREIHHRVKNNLQSVSALLRLQARRTRNDEAKRALHESVRRVASIALVHETLSMSVDEHVDIDEVIDRLIPIMADVAPSDGRAAVTVIRRGDIGPLDADRAMPLVMVVTELIQNALEHAYGPGDTGTVELLAQRSTRMLKVTVHDDGAGLPEGFTVEGSDRLGLQIVRTLVTSELGGELSLGAGAGGGTDAVVRVPLQPS